MSRFPWGVFLALLLGFGAGLAYAWVISPLQVVDAVPSALRDDFKDQYRSAIAAAYAGAGNIERAQARLALLGDTNSIEALNAQAQRLLANGEFQSADQVVLLSAALQGNGIALVRLARPCPFGGATAQRRLTCPATRSRCGYGIAPVGR